ncbi:hypothetical protein CEP54_014050 [Fusarium duplospermum]|uniref:Heterokaryon incompatibility domain-containing protein n=1 Tax=Fusarium duplospermum TaxID=1325734 RepID=A0A428NZ67_9HYPO|nr:hypothetical protein CEP54_014050 [Fusarium duplospermum]
MKLWVDAICINQEDKAEKSHQVPFMKNIYSKANIVFCWLGPPSKSIHKAMDAIEIVAHERRIRCADGVDYALQDELLNCADQLRNQVDKLNKVIADESVNLMSVASDMLKDAEVFAFANSLQHATNVISGALQRRDGVVPTLNLCWTSLTRACRDVTSWYDRFLAWTSKPGLAFKPHSRLIDHILALLSTKNGFRSIHGFTTSRKLQVNLLQVPFTHFSTYRTGSAYGYDKKSF